MGGEECDCGSPERCLARRSTCVPPGLRRGETECRVRQARGGSSSKQCSRLGLQSCSCPPVTNSITQRPRGKGACLPGSGPTHSSRTCSAFLEGCVGTVGQCSTVSPPQPSGATLSPHSLSISRTSVERFSACKPKLTQTAGSWTSSAAQNHPSPSPISPPPLCCQDSKMLSAGRLNPASVGNTYCS